MTFPPLDVLKRWVPFHIDALGIVTLLGASDVNLAIGTLTRSPAEYLPLLAGNVIADNSFTKAIPGFVVYNITDGIVATDIAGHKDKRARYWKLHLAGQMLGILTISLLIALAILTGDWWAFANALSMLVGTIARETMVEQNRAALDAAAVKSPNASDSIVKVFCTLPSGESVTIYAPRMVVIDCILTTPVPHFKRLYSFMRGLAWLSFGCHVVALGMTALFNQLLTVVVILSGTVFLVQRFGIDECCIGSRLYIKLSKYQGNAYRAKAYARLHLSTVEEERMVHWNLFPHPSNTDWWTKYRELQSKNSDQAFEKWDEVLASPAQVSSP